MKKPLNLMEVLGECVEHISFLIEECKNTLSSGDPGQVAITSCKKGVIHLMNLLKEATRTISTMLEQTKEERVTSKLNTLTYFIDDMYRRLEPNDPSSLASCLRDEQLDGARICLNKLTGDVKELQGLYEGLRRVEEG